MRRTDTAVRRHIRTFTAGRKDILQPGAAAVASRMMTSTIDMPVRNRLTRSALMFLARWALPLAAAAVGGFLTPGESYATLSKALGNPANGTPYYNSPNCSQAARQYRPRPSSSSSSSKTRRPVSRTRDEDEHENDNHGFGCGFAARCP